MAETPNIPASLEALLKVFNAIGADLQIPFRQGKTQRFISGDQLVPIFNPKNKIWDIGYKVTSGKNVEYRAIPGVSVPLGSYKTMEGKLSVLNIKGTDKKTLGGASLMDRAAAALEDPEVAKRVTTLTGYSAEKVKNNLRQNFSDPIRSTSNITELVFPSGRNPDAGERRILEALHGAGLVSKVDGKFVNRDRALSNKETAKATRIVNFPHALKDKLDSLTKEYERVAGLFGPGKGKAGGTREVAPNEVKRFAELQREIVALREQIAERLKATPGKSTPALERVDPKELTRIAKTLATEGLSEPPTSIDNRDTRQAKAEAEKAQAQRDAAEGKRPEFRGSKPYTPNQRVMIEKLLADLEKNNPNAYLKFLQQNPEFRKTLLARKGAIPPGPLTKEAADKLRGLDLLVQVGSSGGAMRIGEEGRRAGISITANQSPFEMGKPIASSNTTGEEIYGPGNYMTKAKAGSLINALMTLGQRVPKNPQLATGAEALASLPRLPARGVGGADVEAAAGSARFAGAQPLVMTPEQAGMPVKEKAAAREIVDVSRRVQQGFTREQEVKTLSEIDKTLKALGEASPSNALEKAKLTIRLAKKKVAFGNTTDLTKAQTDFADMMVAEITRLKSDLADPKLQKRAEAQMRMLSATGFNELDPKSVAEQAKYIWTLNTAGAAARALDLQSRELRPQERDITSKRIEPFMKDTGEVGSKIGTPPTLISPMQVSGYASNLQQAETSRQVQESNRRAARGEKRVIPAGGLAQQAPEPSFTPGLRNPSDIQGYRLQQNAASTMRYQELVRLAQQRRVANMPEPPPDPAVVARGRMPGQPRRVAESLLVRMMGR